MVKRLDGSRCHLVGRWGPSSHPPKGGTAALTFRPMTIVVKGAGWIRMPIGMEVGLGPGHIVLDGDPARSPKEGHINPPPILDPCLLWPNGWMAQDATWYGGMPGRRRHCVRRGPSCPPPPSKRGRGHSSPTDFPGHIYCGQTAGWMQMLLGTEVGLGAGKTVLHIQLPQVKGHSSALQLFGA